MCTGTLDPVALPGPSGELTERHLCAMVEQGLAGLSAVGPMGRSPDRLREGLQWLTTVSRTAGAMSARWLAELDRQAQEEARQALENPELKAIPNPSDSCLRWLETTLHLSSSAAYGQLCNARRLEYLPRTASAFEKGELSEQQVSVICQAMDQVHKTCLDPVEVETAMLDAATELEPQLMLSRWRQLRYQSDQAAGLDDEEYQHRRRYLNLRRTWSGHYRIEGELDAEGGSTLKTAIHGLLKQVPINDQRTPAQRRADAVAELARYRLNAGDLPEQCGERPHLMVLAELSTMRLEPGSRLAQLDWGPLITGESARRIGCDAALTPVLVDAQGEVLHVGRSSRSVSPRLRMALNLRDRHCQWDGCLRRPDECIPHHIVHFVDGGPTDLSNLRLYCDVHHRRLHPENARYYRTAGDAWTGVQPGAP